ncbi:hypothetical protein ACN267_12995 [Micromonospora sp. WMMD734]|uniref:hypothetical protein n=1 Tax=Micromonospora sp. WMMD734 TaxID=3404129 RepID=UPI003B93AE2A
MTRYVRFAYPAALLVLFIVGMVVDLPIWQAALLGIAGMALVLIADLILARSRKDERV